MEDSPQDPSIPPPPTPKDFLTTLRGNAPDRLQVATSILNRGLDINCLYEFPKGGMVGAMVPRDRVTALFDAAERGDLDVVQFLLARGADIRVKNFTGAGLGLYPLFPENAVETLCGLDGMRTSPNKEIVRLAEERYGVETEEDFVRRRDAFEGPIGGAYGRSSKTGETRKKMETKRVKSVLPKSRRHAKSQDREEKSHSADEDGRKRYGLRSRNTKIVYT